MTDQQLELMSFDDYQVATGSTAIYPGQGTVDGLVYVTLGLVGEVGELANKVKKILRDNGGVLTDEVRAVLLPEAGDAQWYLARFVDELAGSLSDVAAANLEKLQGRKERGVLGGSGDNR